MLISSYGPLLLANYWNLSINKSSQYLYILWGSQAQSYSKYITNPKHKSFIGGHPSPEARSEKFFCKNYFTNTNNFLKEMGVEPIKWSLVDKLPKDIKKGVWHWDFSQ